MHQTQLLTSSDRKRRFRRPLRSWHVNLFFPFKEKTMRVLGTISSETKTVGINGALDGSTNPAKNRVFP